MAAAAAVAAVITAIVLITGDDEAVSTSTPPPSNEPPRYGRQVDEGPPDIPADFPLDLRLRAMVGDGGERLGPGEDVEALSKDEICGAPVWSMDYLHRIGAVGTGPEFADVRELRTYLTTDEANLQMEAFLNAVLECPSYQNQVITLHDAETGLHTFTWSRTYTEGLGSTLYQATRVGRAVLLTAVSGEGSLENVETGIPEQTELTQDLAQEMCVFTAPDSAGDGCS